MSEGRLSLKLAVTIGNVNVSEFICEVIASFEDIGRVLTFDKLTELSALIRIGGFDLTLIGGSGGLVRAEFIIDNINMLSDFSGFISTYRRLISLLPTRVSAVKGLELMCVYEAYIPIAYTAILKPSNISKVLSSYGILVDDVNTEVLDGVELINVMGTYVVAGLGAVRTIYSTLLRNYAVRSSFTMSKNVGVDDISVKTLKKLIYEVQVLAQVINEELYYRDFVR
ncbi:MAG: hypothetical protein QXZ63_02275 [Sulfolobales archaeon]